ncbi:MAG: hypothetical protein PHH59_00705 [Methylovulum sp.]|uniref:hypothetical protein n=1 Tax=Methylovulum sp. TaxID=1916980 RepID=UPI00261A8360|nr:hypothetical protein [Methylovulum sp.]MDD2722526.1 hypothetical protein [Methylovulum sp.]MDD5123054.1 hypothetical protein [Methylovulum sp.]
MSKNLITDAENILKLVPVYFVKFFEKECYADQFISGELYLNSLAYFKKVEKNCDDGRADRHEAVEIWCQPKDFISMSFPANPHLDIAGEDLIEPVSMSRNDSDFLHVFCMYAISVTPFKTINGEIIYTEEEVIKFKEQFKIDEQCFKFGKFAVIMLASNFLNKIRQSQQAFQDQGYSCVGRLVDYYDDELFSGRIEEQDVPFKKHKRFSYQKEFRICFYQKTRDKKPIKIKIEDIKPFCVKIESDKINSLLSSAEFNFPMD